MCRMLYGHIVKPRSYSILSNISLEIGSKSNSIKFGGVPYRVTISKDARCKRRAQGSPFCYIEIKQAARFGDSVNVRHAGISLCRRFS